MILAHFEGYIMACFSLFYLESVVFGASVLLKNNKNFRIKKNYSKAFQTYFYDLLLATETDLTTHSWKNTPFLAKSTPGTTKIWHVLAYST